MRPSRQLNLVPHRPPYVVLCNFDEFWIYDFNTQLYEPLYRVPVAELPACQASQQRLVGLRALR